ncbi:hypothetical protein NM688_g3479 [Phlebia brevispora]|uniref:Uncharacterized protein n=1 Tax=Phlebia brevispora TaxID=194682 RepID=A0ACC1T5E6_9APHY|nr:hypothetical protein NM688_g3479 [Phlebia brevispora]
MWDVVKLDGLIVDLDSLKIACFTISVRNFVTNTMVLDAEQLPRPFFDLNLEDFPTDRATCANITELLIEDWKLEAVREQSPVLKFQGDHPKRFRTSPRSKVSLPAFQLTMLDAGDLRAWNGLANASDSPAQIDAGNCLALVTLLGNPFNFCSVGGSGIVEGDTFVYSIQSNPGSCGSVTALPDPA